jgi:hypothetical protein
MKPLFQRITSKPYQSDKNQPAPFAHPIYMKNILIVCFFSLFAGCSSPSPSSDETPEYVGKPKGVRLIFVTFPHMRSLFRHFSIAVHQVVCSPIYMNLHQK